MNNFIFSFIITFIAGISTLIGGLIPFLNKGNKDKGILTSLAFAAGIMVSISLLDLLPESFNYLNSVFDLKNTIVIMFLFCCLGIIIFYILDKLLVKDVDNLYRVGLLSMISIVVHNIPEGIVTFVLSKTDIRLGLFMGLSIALHNIPEGVSIMVPIYYGTGNFKKAFFYTLVAGLAEVFGGVLFYLLFSKYISDLMIGILFSIITGIMLYLSFFELLPKSLGYKSSSLTLFFFLMGIVCFLFISIFMH